jgi:metallo-beta-lactamase class B
MNRCLTVACFIFLLSAGWVAVDANAQAAAAQAHVAAAKAAVAPKAPDAKPWHVYQNLFNELCAENREIDAMRASMPQGKWLPLKEWHYPAHKFFDNLYFIGTKTAGMYVINTSAGMIIIDTNFDWNVEENILSLLQFGLDPANIKYVIVTSAHTDRYWGAKTIQDVYPKAHIIMSEADWSVVAKDNSPAAIKPKKDMVATDGQKLTLGNTTVTIYITPGDTPGTLSLIFPAVETPLQMTYEKPKRGPHNHMVALWGGTDFNVGRQGVTYWPDGQALFKTYLASLARFKGLADAAGVDVIITPSMTQQNGIPKLADARILEQDSTQQTNQLVARLEKGEIITHPFISKDDVERYFTIERECAQAQLAWRTGL